MNKPRYIIIHHSLVSRQKNANQFDAVDRYHTSKGWGMIGYHYFLEPSGELKHGRNETVTGAHCKQKLMNYRSIGICLAGNFDMEEPTEEQKMQLLNLIKDIQGKYDIPDKNVLPHRHFATYKSCWGNKLPNDILGYLQAGKPEVAKWAKIAWHKALDKKVVGRNSMPTDQITKQELMVFFDRLDLL